MRTVIAAQGRKGIDMVGMALAIRAGTVMGMCAAMYRAMMSDVRHYRAATSSFLGQSKDGPCLREGLQARLRAAGTMLLVFLL